MQLSRADHSFHAQRGAPLALPGNTAPLLRSAGRYLKNDKPPHVLPSIMKPQLYLLRNFSGGPGLQAIEQDDINRTILLDLVLFWSINRNHTKQEENLESPERRELCL